MSDIPSETTAPPATSPVEDDASLEARVTALESRVSTLEARVTALESRVSTLENAPAPPVRTQPGSTTGDTEPDEDARVAELQEQGMSEEDAIEQAAYEHRLWTDRHHPAAP